MPPNPTKEIIRFPVHQEKAKNEIRFRDQRKPTAMLGHHHRTTTILCGQNTEETIPPTKATKQQNKTQYPMIFYECYSPFFDLK